MKKHQVEIFCFDALVVEDYGWVKPNQLNVTIELLQKMAEMGIITMSEKGIPSDHVQRIYKALRLRKTLGINLAGAGIILELLDEVEHLRDEIKKLKRDK
ncbi:MAG: chaperone modulator CbpM [Bacillota bacterium]|nr:chaperone modulator CbpM [Bacillota bacterium]